MARPDWMLGRDIQDATRRVTINIRQHHIDNAVALNGEECVAGRCTLQALDAAYCWYYRHKAYVVWDDDTPILRYQCSEALTKRVIEILDDPERPNSDIQPGLYDLLPPPPTQRLGVDRTRREDSEERGSRPNRKHRVMGRITAARHK